MTTTQQLVTIIQSAKPADQAIAHARAELDLFRLAAERGADHPVVTALRTVLGADSSPPARAWLAATSAAAGDGQPPEWIAVCAAAGAFSELADRVAEATAIGYQVAELVAAALGGARSGTGWSVQCTAGVIGAGAAAGRLLGLDAEPLRNLLGISATQAAGLTSAEGTDAGALQIGKASADGVEAALLSRNGFTSSAEPVEGRRGLLALMGARTSAADAVRNTNRADTS
jgi:2-methylcitrate dehydratase PrpD